MGIALGQIRMVTSSGIKGKDDFIDTISQLAYLTPWKPSDSMPATPDEVEVWEEIHGVDDINRIDSYIV